MNKVHVLDLLPAYGLGILDAEEALQVEAHLLNCRSCRRESERWNALTGDLAYAVRLSDPEPSLEDRIVAALPPRKERSRFLWEGWAVAAAVVLVLNSAFWLLVQPPTRPEGLSSLELHSNNTAYSQASGQLFFDPETRTGILAVQGLPPLPVESQYQFWLVESGKWIDAGTFDVSSSGTSSLRVSFPDDPGRYQRYCVSIEPRGGSAKPSALRPLIGNI